MLVNGIAITRVDRTYVYIVSGRFMPIDDYDRPHHPYFAEAPSAIDIYIFKIKHNYSQ